MVTGVFWRKHPVSGDFDTATNWSTNTVPVVADNAVFGTSKITSLTFSSASTSVGHWTFLKGAPNYHFQIDANHTVDIALSGISMKDNHVSINNQGFLGFYGAGSAAKTKIVNDEVLSFHQDATAGNAKIINSDTLSFFDTSKGGHANFENHGTIHFTSQSTAASATITTVAFGATYFEINGTGGNARLIAQTGGIFDFSQSTGPESNSKVSAGSISGAGVFYLGATFLTVGSNNRSTVVSGAVNDGGADGGTGAVLDKIGTGTLKLTHPGNGYSGGTLLESGTLDIAAVGAAGTGGIVFLSGTHAKLKIENSALSSHDFADVLAAFGVGQKIDLAGLKFHTHAKATYDGASHVLTVKSGHVTDTLHLLGPDPGTFKVTDDGHGGCKIVIQPFPHTGREHHGASVVDAAESFRFGDLAELRGSKQSATTHSEAETLGHDSVGTLHIENETMAFVHPTEQHFFAHHDFVL